MPVPLLIISAPVAQSPFSIDRLHNHSQTEVRRVLCTTAGVGNYQTGPGGFRITNCSTLEWCTAGPGILLWCC